MIKCTDQQKTVSVLLNMLEKGKFPCFWCSTILQRVNQLPRRAIIITWENYNSMGKNRTVQWTLNCQTAGWCFSWWLEVPSLIKLCIGFKGHDSTTQGDVYFKCQNLCQEPLAGPSALVRVHPQLHNPFLFLVPLSSHHSYEDSLEEEHRVRQSKCYPMQQTPHQLQWLVKLLNIKGDN